MLPVRLDLTPCGPMPWSDTVTGMRAKRAVGSVTSRQTKRGRRFYVRVTQPNGKRTTRGSWATKAEAEAAIPNVVAEVRAQQRNPNDATLSEWLDSSYLRVMSGRVSASTLPHQVAQIRAFAAWVIDHADALYIREVERRHAEEYVAELISSRKSGTVDRHISTLSVAWQAAMLRGLADHNPWTGHTYRKDEEYEVPWVDPGDLRRILAALRPRSRDFARLLADTGLRRGEAFGLEWRDVDFDRCVMLVRRSLQRPSPTAKAGPTKGRNTREVPLLDGTRELLERRHAARSAVPLRGPDRIFSGPHPDALRYDLELACALVSHPRLRIHDLRHVYASHLIWSGMPIPVVERLLGHAPGSGLVAKRYGRWMPSNATAQAASALEQMRAGKATRSSRHG